MSALPVLGFWGLARRIVRERTRGGAMLADILESRPPYPSHKWFATAERYRLEDERRRLAATVKHAREPGSW